MVTVFLMCAMAAAALLARRKLLFLAVLSFVMVGFLWPSFTRATFGRLRGACRAA